MPKTTCIIFPPRCSLRQFEVRDLWHFLLWHIMETNSFWPVSAEERSALHLMQEECVYMVSAYMLVKAGSETGQQ